MSVVYQYLQVANSEQLKDEIATAGLPAPANVQIDGTDRNFLSITFDPELSNDQKSTLDTVVNNHVANPAYVTLADQALQNTLIGYLNNPNTAISNVARSVVVVNIAPRLGSDLISSINLQIAKKLAGG